MTQGVGVLLLGGSMQLVGCACVEAYRDLASSTLCQQLYSGGWCADFVTVVVPAFVLGLGLSCRRAVQAATLPNDTVTGG